MHGVLIHIAGESFTLSSLLLTAWSILPTIVGATATLFGIIGSLVQIYDSSLFQGWLKNHRRRRIVELKEEVEEASEQLQG